MAVLKSFYLALPCTSILVAFMLTPVLSCNSCTHRSKLAYYHSKRAIKAGACGYGSFAARLNGPNVAAASPRLYRDGVGCSACYQIRCLDPSLCRKTWQKIVVTDLTTNNQTDFVVPKHTFAALALPHKGAALRRKGIVDMEYERIFCEYKGHNLSAKVDSSSRYPDYLAVEFLYQGGQTDIVNVDVAQVGGFDWKYLTRNHGAVWNISNPPIGGLQFRFLVTSGYEGYMLWARKAVLPPHWKAGGRRLYDTGLQINQTALDGCTNSCDVNQRV
ncbi:expansin-like A1 [Cryptomeria japonica]|uniref:expansin-like A1 n=1 Tax=Cryptomeria japonica TaxID=3369 RepID=UPI0027DA97B0|nr:expansin-like A1 [Cryptomeria japonica]